MKRKITVTADGSHSISIEGIDVNYHSRFGAIQESRHVFIETGLHKLFDTFKLSDTLNILEVGFGTGLNALLTYMESEETRHSIRYTTIELFPLSLDEIGNLNYPQLLNDKRSVFRKIHECNWNEEVQLTELFTLRKENIDVNIFSTNDNFHLVYYDAFSPSVQPELWTKTIFEKVYYWVKERGILVTYCSKGDVRRFMISAGFSVEKIPGPPGKREILRAIKISE